MSETMNSATREMVKLALTSDSSISSDLVAAISRLLDGTPPPPPATPAVPPPPVAPLPAQANEPLLMNFTVAAAHLGISRVTLWRLVKDCVLKPVEIRPHVFRLRRQDLDKFASCRSRYTPTKRGKQAKDA